MSPVQLDDVVAGLRGPPRGRGEVGRHRADFVGPQRARLGVLRVGDGAGPHQVPAVERGGARAGGGVGPPRGRARLAPAVTQLDAGERSGRVDRLDDAAMPGHLGVVPQAQIEGGQAAVGGDRGRLHDDGAEGALGARGVVKNMPVGDDAIAGVDAVSAHGRQPQAVARGQAAHGQGPQDGRRAHDGHATRRGPRAEPSPVDPAAPGSPSQENRRRAGRGGDTCGSII